MNILKKITGYFLILIAGLLSIGTFGTFFQVIIKSIVEIKTSLAEGLGYLFGSLLMLILFVLITIFIMKLGLKLIKAKAIPEDSIDDIGL